ncbi:MAG: methyl-accepting chemotaxis protein [Legionellales bacterium]|nr:methyl-accepting chemotaxis protein [Legionellales bacterium]
MKYGNYMESLSIRGRLMLGFGAIILILVISAGITLSRVNTVKSVATHFIGIDVPFYDSTADMYINIYRMQNAVNLAIVSQTKNYQTELTQAESNIDRIQSDIDDDVNHLSNASISESWASIKTNINELRALNAQALSTTDTSAAATLLITKINPMLNSILDVLDGSLNEQGERAGGLLTVEYNNLQNQGTAVTNDVGIIAFAEYAVLLAGIIISLFIVYFTSRSIIRYVNLIREQSSRIAAGDLTKRIVVINDDEMGQLCGDLNSMTDSLAKMTKLINDASVNMVTSLSEVRQSANMQSSGASEQASSINEITASLEEIEKSSNQTNEKAKTLGETAERSHVKGQQGLEAVAQSINGMKIVGAKVQIIAQTILDLSNQTQQVGEITAVVNNLAQQLKMLALNASIEAVKAGETGKGFSVVATEVKNLAERSEQSTVQVQKILENIRQTAEKAVMATEEGTKGVDLGTQLVEQAGEIVRDLTNVINETSIATQQIEAAIRQESVGIEQITLGMNEINQVTASFVASTRQTTEAVEHLFTIAKEIREYIAVYQVDTARQ